MYVYYVQQNGFSKNIPCGFFVTPAQTRRRKGAWLSDTYSMLLQRDFPLVQLVTGHKTHTLCMHPHLTICEAADVLLSIAKRVHVWVCGIDFPVFIKLLSGLLKELSEMTRLRISSSKWTISIRCYRGARNTKCAMFSSKDNGVSSISKCYKN